MTPTPIRNRIKSHCRIRAGDLIPHEWNFRAHPEMQRAALMALYQGAYRFFLAFENGRRRGLVFARSATRWTVACNPN